MTVSSPQSLATDPDRDTRQRPCGAAYLEATSETGKANLFTDCAKYSR
jgi:hypothetical protein